MKWKKFEEEQVGNINSEHESIRSECKTELYNR
jgi:hypothetical protein